MNIEKRWTDYRLGSTRLDLTDGARSVSHLDGIVPLTLRFGVATVRADIIAGLGTEEDCRGRGYARRVMEAALGHMAAGDAALSVVHGIRDFYHRFGYAPVGPSYLLSAGTTVNAGFGPPAGYRTRECGEDDLPAIRALYEAGTRDVLGAAVRSSDGFVWAKLRDSMAAGECRVVEDERGTVVAYAWQARGCWAVRVFEAGGDDNAFSLGEVVAADSRAADAVLTACRAWAAEEAARRGQPIHQIRFALPPVGPIAAALRFQHSLSQQKYQPNGGFMARVVSVERLLDALTPELARRLAGSGLAFAGTLRLRADIGGGVLRLPGAASRAGRAVDVALPQAALARLVFGGAGPDDILDRCGARADEPARDLLRVLFPAGHPHVFLPDQC